MITRQEFPYLQELLIHDACVAKHLRVPVFEPGQEFRHLVLTGRSGAGKTTVLRDLAANEAMRFPYPNARPALRRNVEASFYGRSQQHSLEVILRSRFVFAFFEATRRLRVQEVTSVVRADALEAELSHPENTQLKTTLFKQFLVNKKVFHVFDALDGKMESARQKESFFRQLDATLALLFEDPGARLEFVRENFEFYLHLSDGRRLTLNDLSAGYSALLSIFMELLMRVDLLRTQVGDYGYDPCGFVLIDEPEAHLHPEMQRQLLPLLAGLFPNLQFIVATHSPAVAFSLPTATVFDLSTGQALPAPGPEPLRNRVPAPLPAA